jgi:hypothetical protein
MLTLLLAALAAPQGLVVDGLRPGERLEVIPGIDLPENERERFDEGRVVDATSGLPVAGAQLEAWTEEITEASAGFRRVGETVTGPDGLFTLRVQQGALRGDKIRVRAAGYLTLSTTPGDGLLRLMPAPTEPARLRIVDLHDRPIAGARITSTYSCSHDLPAFDVRTDAFGLARLPEWGLQDQTSQLRVRADGYDAIEYLYDDEALVDLQDLDAGTFPIVRLGRQRPIRARVLDREGLPLVATPLEVIDEECYHVVVTGEDGGFEVLARYGNREVVVHALRGGRREFVAAARLPASERVVLRLDSQSPPDDLPQVDVTLRAAEWESEHREMEPALFHVDGWTEHLRWHHEEGIATGSLPPGDALLHIGGAFSGWEEQLVELELVEDRPVELRVGPRREPQLTVLTPPEEAESTWRLIVEAGEDSFEDDGVEDSGETTLRVPAGRPLTILVESDRTRRLTLPPLEGDATADLRPDACLLPRSVAQRRDVLARTTLRVRAVGADGEDLAGGELGVAGVGDPSVSLVDGAWEVEAASGTPVLLQHRGEGVADLDEVVHAPLPGEPMPEVVLSPTALATVAIESELGFDVLGPLAEELDWTGLVHPGPLTLTLRLEDGRRIALALELAPGEQRTLTVRGT